MEIRTVRAELWSLPLHAPFAISQRIAYTAENVFIFLDCMGDDGPVTGCGASAPVAYVTGETTDTVLAAVAGIERRLSGIRLFSRDEALEIVNEELASMPAARAGLEIAIYDAWGKANGRSLWQLFGGAQPSVQTDITIPITPPAAAGVLAAKAAEAGFNILKIKVGACEGPEEDLARIRAIAQSAPASRIRIDANQAFAAAAAIDFIHKLGGITDRIELIEQPVVHSDIEGLKTVRGAIDYPVFADEAVCTAEDARRLIEHDAVDGINIKLMKSGITGALEIIDLCKAAGKKLMIGCMLETELGIAAAAQLAAGTGAFDHIDLDSHRLLAPVPQITGGITHAGDIITVDTHAAGWGVQVKQD